MIAAFNRLTVDQKAASVETSAPMTTPMERSQRTAIESSLAFGKYRDAEGYDSYMGEWSAALAPLFLQFAALGHPTALLDIGSGTGNLLAAATAAFPCARLIGIDPSATLLQRARTRPELAGVEFVLGGADNLPFLNGTVDCCLSLLVLQEFSDRHGPLCEMRRVTRSGGIIAACQWDFSRMPVIAALVDAIAMVDSEAGSQLATRSPRLVASEAELSQAWTDGGFKEVSAGRIEVARQFRNFDELWSPLLAGSTPSTMTLAALPKVEREVVRKSMMSRLAGGSFDASLYVTAEALVVRGRV